MTGCKVLNCDRAAHARGMCTMHHKRHLTASRQRPDIFLGAFGSSIAIGGLPEHRPDLGPCWDWTGTLNAQGYGVVSRQMFGSRLVHRVAFMLHHGRVIEADLMHHCDNPKCLRPSHLREATHAENMADRAAKGRAFAPRAGQSMCKHGHELTEETTTLYERTDGYTERRCNECRRINNKLQAERRKRARRERGLYKRRNES